MEGRAVGDGCIGGTGVAPVLALVAGVVHGDGGVRGPAWGASFLQLLAALGQLGRAASRE